MQLTPPEQYPDAYCLKCGAETPTKFKQTVLMTNQSRALKGVCSKCESEVYRIMSKIRAATVKATLSAEEKKRYPDAYCFKCQSHTATNKAHTVMLDNMSRAVTGACSQCGSQVYRILNHAPMAPKAAVMTAAKSLTLIPKQIMLKVERRASRKGDLVALPFPNEWIFATIALGAFVLGVVLAIFQAVG